MKSVVLPHLETFAKAAELSSFTAAARSLGVSQAAVSQNVQALEKALATSLFHRQAGHVLLTQAGQRLYGFTERILSLYEEARREVTGKKDTLVSELYLAASSIPGEYHLPDLLERFRRRHPHVRIRVAINDSDAVLSLIEQGKAQLGLVGKKGTQPSLEFRRFARDRMALVVPAAHRWARRKQVTLRELCQEPLILREVGSGSRGCFEQALAQAGTSFGELQVVLELGSNEAIKEMVSRGLGLTVLSNEAVQKEVQAGQLHTLRVKDLDLERDMYVVWDRRRVLPPAGHLFRDFLAPSPHKSRL